MASSLAFLLETAAASSSESLCSDSRCATPVTPIGRGITSQERHRCRFQNRSYFIVISLSILVAFASLKQSIYSSTVRMDTPGAKEFNTSNPRDFLQVGSVYQNAYMTLWNKKGQAVSVLLHIYSGDYFELKALNIDGSFGAWFTIKGHFLLVKLPRSSPDRLHIVPPRDGRIITFDWDPLLLDARSAFAMKCMQRLGNAALTTLRLEVDTGRDAVSVTPSSSLLRSVWDQGVDLNLANPQHMWEPSIDDIPPASVRRLPERQSPAVAIHDYSWSCIVAAGRGLSIAVGLSVLPLLSVFAFSRRLGGSSRFSSKSL